MQLLNILSSIRCLMNLTQPARIVFKNEIPQDKITRHCYIETATYLQNYKQVILYMLHIIYVQTLQYICRRYSIFADVIVYMQTL